MSLEEKQSILEDGGVVELVFERRPGYVAAHYLVFVKGGQYRCTVQYEGERTRRVTPVAQEREWARLVRELTIPLAEEEGWQVFSLDADPETYVYHQFLEEEKQEVSMLLGEVKAEVDAGKTVIFQMPYQPNQLATHHVVKKDEQTGEYSYSIQTNVTHFVLMHDAHWETFARNLTLPFISNQWMRSQESN